MVAFDTTGCKNTTHSQMNILEMRVHTPTADVPSSPLAWHLVYENHTLSWLQPNLWANVDKGTTRGFTFFTPLPSLLLLQCCSSFILLRADPALNHKICVSLKVWLRSRVSLLPSLCFNTAWRGWTEQDKDIVILHSIQEQLYWQ